MLDYVRPTDLQEHGEIVAHRIETAITASQQTTDPGIDRESAQSAAQAANTLAAATEATSSLKLGLEAKLDRILTIATEEMGFPIGYATRIEDGMQEILAATGDHDAIQPGATDPLERTYCRRTIEQDRPVVVEDAPDEGLADDPAYQHFGLRCYVGAPIIVDGEPYGTLCLADEQPRQGLVGDLHQATVKALANWVGYEIERQHYETALTERRNRLRVLFDKAPDGIVVHNADGSVLDVNETIVEELGYTRAELLSMDVSEFEVGFNREFLTEAWEDMDDELPLKVEGQHQRHDGSTYPVEVWVSKTDSTDGEQYIAVCRDVTERKERERELERYEAFVQHSSAIVTELDESGTITYQSPAIGRVLGYEPDDLLGEHAFEYIHPDDQERVTDAFAANIDEPRAKRTIEFRFESASGEYRWLHAIGANHLDDPAVGGVVVNSIDVTDRKQREQELEQYEHLWKHLPVGVCRIDPAGDGEFLAVNEALVDIVGADSKADVLDRSVAEFWTDKDDRMAFLDDLTENPRVTTERRFETLDGQQVWLRVIVMSHDSGRYVDTVVEDVTDRREREIHLEKAQESGDIGWWRKDIPSDEIYWSERVYEMWGADGDGGPVDHETFMEYVHPDDREDVAQTWEAAKAGDPYDIEHRIVTGDGEHRWMREKADMTFDDRGDPVSAVGIVQDITDRKQRERELERYRAYLESANDMVTLIAPDGTIEYVSPAVERILRYTQAELIGENGFEYLHSNDRDDQRENIDTLIDESDGEMTLEFRFECAEGGYCWIEATARNLLDNPDVDGILLSSRDITDRKEHEQQLSALHGATRQLIDADSKAAVAKTAVEAASTLLDFTLPSVWYPSDDGSELALVANSQEHQALLEEAGTPDPAHPEESWIWDVVEEHETVVKSPIPQEELAADVPLQSTIVLPLGEHGVFACAAKGEVDFTERQIRVAEILARNARVALDQLDQRAALERQKAFTDDLLDAIEDVVYVIDPDGDLRQWNDALEQVTGYTSAEISSMNAVDFFAGKDRDAAADAVREAFETGRTRVELEFVTSDGEAIPYEFMANVFEDPDGQPVMAGIGRDRTVHVEYEQELERYKELIDNVPAGIYRNTPGEAGEFVEVNPAMVEIFDADSTEELLDIPVRDLYTDPDARQSFSDAILEEGIVKEKEMQLETLDGQTFWGSVTAMQFEAADETYLDGVVQDITERVEYEQRLEEQRDNLDILNQMVRHDIRNDLQLIIAYAEMIEDELEGKHKEYVEIVLENAENAVGLTKTARDLAEAMLHEETDVKSVPLKRTLETQIEEIRTANEEVVVTVCDPIPSEQIYADGMLDSVFRNLLTNAVAHNDKDVPEIEIHVEEADEHVLIEIADNGPGVPDEQKEEIFGKGAKGLESEGTGMGLYLVHTLVDSAAASPSP